MPYTFPGCLYVSVFPSRQELLYTFYNVTWLWILPRRLCSLHRWSPTFLTSGTCFMKDNFSIDWSDGVVSGWFKHITLIVHFISIVITPAPPQIIRPVRSWSLGTLVLWQSTTSCYDSGGLAKTMDRLMYVCTCVCIKRGRVGMVRLVVHQVWYPDAAVISSLQTRTVGLH